MHASPAGDSADVLLLRAKQVSAASCNWLVATALVAVVFFVVLITLLALGSDRDRGDDFEQALAKGDVASAVASVEKLNVSATVHSSACPCLTVVLQGRPADLAQVCSAN